MFRDLLSSRAIHVGLVCFVLIVGGTQLYSWHVRRGIKAEEARTQQFRQQLETKKETHAVQDTGEFIDTQTLGQAETPLETDGTQTMSGETEAVRDEAFESLDTADAFLPDDIVSEAEPAEVRVSPHGLGRYPEIPEGAPIAPFDERDSKDMELLGRVMVKKWNEGERFVGGTINDGKVYLIYPHILYVKWEVKRDFLTGKKTRSIIRTRGPSTVRLTREQKRTGEIPHGIQVIDMDSAGLDPYEILDLP